MNQPAPTHTFSCGWPGCTNTFTGTYRDLHRAGWGHLNHRNRGQSHNLCPTCGHTLMDKLTHAEGADHDPPRHRDRRS